MYKSQLNLYCQKHRWPIPDYKTENPYGQSHVPIFPSCTVTILEKEETAEGEFKNKKEAEEAAAKKMLDLLTRKEKLALSSSNFSKNSKPIFIEEGHSSSRKGSPPRRRGSPPRQRGSPPRQRISQKEVSVTQNLAESSLQDSDKSIIYLIDYDNKANLRAKIENGKEIVHIFVAFNMDRSILPQSENCIIHQAKLLIPEIVDHMITAYAFSNLETLKGYDKVYIVSADKGVFASSMLMKEAGINAELVRDMLN